MTDLAAWLLEQIAEDERVARDAGADAMMGGRWKAYPEGAYNELQSTVLASSRRVLAECAAKRAIVERYVYLADHGDSGDARWVLAALAQPYRDRPGWRDEWATT